MDNWEVSASDDEWNEYNAPESTPHNTMFIPQRLASLFKSIEEEKTLKLSCYCPRVGSKKETQQMNSTQNLTPSHMEEREIPERGEAMDVQEENNKSFEAFDFDNDDNEKPSIKRKTPASAKRGKKEKVGTMSNVMNDLLRHKYLDDLESKAKKEETNPDSKAK